MRVRTVTLPQRNAKAWTPTCSGVLQRKCACGTHASGEQCDAFGKKGESLQRSSIGEGRANEVPPIVHDVLRSPGQALDPTTRAYFEPRFGRDFSQVRVHTDEMAEASARAVGAVAYTVGQDVVFRRGRYAPGTCSGRKLLGHELTHSIQQSPAAAGFSLEIGSPDTAAEREADSVSDALESGRQVGSTFGACHVLQRQTPGGGPAATQPADFGIKLAVIDHGASGVHAAAQARLQEIYMSLRPANLAVLQGSGVTTIELHIIPYDQKIIDLPEFAHLRGTKTPDGRLWDNVRGEGGVRVGSTIRYTIAEENLSGSRHGHGGAIGLGIAGGIGLGIGGAAAGVAIGMEAQGGSSGAGGLIGGIVGGVVGAGLGALGGALLGNALDESNTSGYSRDFLASHEGSHTIELYALTRAQHTRVEALFAARRAAGGPWLAPADYTSSNVHEYFAQCASAFFSRPYQDKYRSSYTPEWLRNNDSGMYALLVEVFGSPAGARSAGTRNDMLDMRYRERAAA
jgi:Domain of unknown function (DUF4157)